MTDLHDALVEAAGDYLTHIRVVGADGIGEAEDKLWVATVRARNRFLAAKDEKEMQR